MASFATSLAFFAQLLPAALLYRLAAPRLSPAWRAGVLIGLSLLFLGQLKAHPVFLLASCLYAALAAAAAGLIGRSPKLRQETLPGAVCIAAAVLILLLFKYHYYASLFLGGLAGLRGFTGFEWLGLSYMTFRAIDLVMQARRSRDASPAPLAAAAYLLFFPAYVSGPINRFQPFAQDLAKPPAPLAAVDLQEIALRLSAGVFKILVLADIFRSNSLLGLSGLPNEAGTGAVLLGLYCQYAFIYFDFAGYSDVAIATARLFGVRLPENFNFPFLARNLQDFWNRWHISFAHWCRDYIYFVLLRWLKLRARFLPDLAANLAAIFATFFFMGAWHGDGLNWILYGVYHGCGMGGLVVLRHVLNALAPGLAQALAASRLFAVLSALFTLSFVAVGLLLTLDVPLALEAAARLLAFLS